MTTEEAIKTAIEYENRVRDTYADAVKNAEDPIAIKVFTTLADEEQGHVEFLEHCLATWREKGILSTEGLRTAVPTPENIERGVQRLKQKLGGKGLEGPEVDMLRRALEVEVETSTFYRKMVDVLPVEGRGLFQRFVEIEDGHKAIVQAEIDTVTGMGFWFDFQEFDLESG
jgi:rubrerythrin